MAVGSKRKARTLAMQALYEADSVGHEPLETLQRLVAAEGSAEGTAVFAEALIRGITDHLPAIDEVIARHAPERPPEELPAIDRNVLRVAIYELLFDNRAPIAAIINEAIEVAKRYGSDHSSRFVNGVLGSASTAAKR